METKWGSEESIVAHSRRADTAALGPLTRDAIRESKSTSEGHHGLQDEVEWREGCLDTDRGQPPPGNSQSFAAEAHNLNIHLEEARKQNSRFRAVLSEKEESVRQHRFKIQRLETDLRNERHANRQFDAKMGEIRKQLDEAQTYSLEMQRSAAQMQSSMDKKELFVGEQMSDEKIREAFKQLLSQIRTWSTKFQIGNVLPVLEDRRSIAELEAIAPDCMREDHKNLWYSGKDRKLLVRGWAMSVMAELLLRTYDDQKVRSQSTDVWTGRELQRSVAAIESQLWAADKKAVSLQKLNDWRALTVDLLSRAVSKHGKDADQVERQLRREVGRLMDTLSAFAPKERVHELEDGLRNVFVTAMEFSKLIRRQRACWTIRSPNLLGGKSRRLSTGDENPQVFDPCWMEDNDSTGNEYDELEDEDPANDARKVVEIVVAPGLFKRGDADGENYDTETCIVQALVQCKTWSPKPRRQRSRSPSGLLNRTLGMVADKLGF